MIKNHWKLTILKDLCDPSDGVQIGPFGSQLHASDYVETGIPVVMPKNMVNNEISSASIACISEETANLLSKHRLKTGDLVFARRGDVGNFSLVQPHQEGWLCGTGSIRVRLKPDIHPEFISLLLQSHKVRHWLQSNAVGQTMLNLNTEIISNLPLRVTDSFETQIALANDIQKWDRAIALAEELIVAKRCLKQGLMQKLLTGQRRFSEFLHTDWISCSLGDLGKCHSGGTPDTKELLYWNGDIQWCTPTDITALKTPFISSTSKSISELGLAKSSAEILPINSVIVCTRATLGYCAVNTVPMATNQGFKSLIPNENVDTMFLYYLVLSLKREMQRRASGSTFMEISKKLFQKIPVRLPSQIDEQKRIAGTLLSLDKHIDCLRQTLDLLKLQKRGVMQKLLTGEIRIPILDDAA